MKVTVRRVGVLLVSVWRLHSFQPYDEEGILRVECDGDVLSRFVETTNRRQVGLPSMLNFKRGSYITIIL